MKKFGLASLVFMLCLSCSIAFTPINVSAASVNVKPYDTTIETNIVLNHEDEVELAGFMKMQDKITNTLSLKDGKYIYNEEKIREIVYEYDFNVYNKKYNTSWTKQSFFNSAMKNIRDFKDVKKSNGACQVETRGTARATMCGQNWESSGWNYVRVARNTSGAKKLANEMDDAADLCATVGAGAAASTISVPVLAAVLGSFGGIGKAYYNSYARWIRYNNDLTSCGIVTDQNKFTQVYDIWTQPEFANK